jgi:hypothetical protein
VPTITAFPIPKNNVNRIRLLYLHPSSRNKMSDNNTTGNDAAVAGRPAAAAESRNVEKLGK